MDLQDNDWHLERKSEEELDRRRQRDAADGEAPPPPGAHWDWSIKLLVWLCAAVLMLVAWRALK